jgi:Uncharacterized conserved protein (DUF2190)
MKTEQPILITSITASGDAGATISKNLLIGFTGAILSNGAKQLGVCNADTYVGEQMPVMVTGIALIKSYAAITLGAALMCGDEGKVSPKDAGGELVGYALDAANGADELIRVLLK